MIDVKVTTMRNTKSKISPPQAIKDFAKDVILPKKLIKKSWQ